MTRWWQKPAALLATWLLLLLLILLLAHCSGCSGVHWPWQAIFQTHPDKNEVRTETTHQSLPDGPRKTGKVRITIRPLSITTRPAEVPHE